ncbi:hypothetical protein [Corynebacterium sp.]|uniref:hypothetical protein n=1 Tax=Corynebacterium sp. TaxID=1720 RepID=UPI0026DAE6E0|nr:hypothetical protein [Corynebacterium sp.]MDO5032177.1 hypothetical protein [Corynebacterium sp.]
MSSFARRFLAPVAASALIVAGMPAIAQAAPDPTTGVELNVESDQFVGGTYIYNPSNGTIEGAKALKELRGYMWDVNPPFKGYSFDPYNGTLQDAARQEGITTKEQYQDIKIDQDLNWIAVQRAVEITGVWGHVRPDGSETASATRGDRAPEVESLAMGNTLTMRTAIMDSWGKGELKALQQANGEWSTANGHLVHLLHPRHTVWGFGGVHTPGKGYEHFFAAVNGSELVTQGSTKNLWYKQTLYRAPKDGERATGLLEPKPGESEPLAGKPDLGYGKGGISIGLSSDNPEAVKGINIALGVISAIIALVGLANQIGALDLSGLLSRFLPR